MKTIITPDLKAFLNPETPEKKRERGLGYLGMIMTRRTNLNPDQGSTRNQQKIAYGEEVKNNV